MIRMYHSYIQPYVICTMESALILLCCSMMEGSCNDNNTEFASFSFRVTRNSNDINGIEDSGEEDMIWDTIK